MPRHLAQPSASSTSSTSPDASFPPSHIQSTTPKPWGPSPFHASGPEARHRSPRRVLGVVLLVVAVLLMATALVLLIDAFSKYRAQDEVNDRLTSYVTISDDPSSAPQVDWAALEAVDPNVCAWVQIPNTPINFPVYQAEDNNYYLRTNAYGEYSIGGQVFLDCENANPGLVDEQTVVYGHHLQNGAMFATLADFDEQSVFDAHKTVWYVTKTEGASELEPLLCYRTVGSDLNVRIFNWPTREDFHSYLKNLLGNSKAHVREAEAIIDGTDHVLTLSTCSYEEENGRTLLVCVPKSEASSALSLTSENEAQTISEVPFSEPTPKEDS